MGSMQEISQWGQTFPCNVFIYIEMEADKQVLPTT